MDRVPSVMQYEYLILGFGHHYATPGDASTQMWRFQAWVDGVVAQEWTFPAGGSLNQPHVSSVLSELGGRGWCLAANGDFKTFSNGNFVFTRQQVPNRQSAS